MSTDSYQPLLDLHPEIFNVVDRNATPSWRLHDHLMNFHNLMLIYDGNAVFSQDHVQFQASRGDLIYYKPGIRREAHTFPDRLMKCFAVDFQYTCPVYTNPDWTFVQCDLPFAPLERIEDDYLLLKLIDLFSQLTKANLSGNNHNKSKKRAIFSEILTLLFQYKEGDSYTYASMRKVNRLINYMIEHHADTITLKELAEHAQISPSYLGTIFKKTTGKSPIDYLIEIRLNKAKSLLKDGVAVTETAKRVGFNDVFYFSRTFKKHEGISPTQYTDLSHS